MKRLENPPARWTLALERGTKGGECQESGNQVYKDIFSVAGGLAPPALGLGRQEAVKNVKL